MNELYLCPECLNSVRHPEEPCEVCGYKITSRKSAGRISPGTILKETYYIGAVRFQDRTGETYLTKNLSTGETGLVREIRTEKQKASEAEKKIETTEALIRKNKLSSLILSTECFSKDDSVFLVYPIRNGVSLKDLLIKEKEPFREAFLLKYLKPVANDLAILHKNGISHHGITPDHLITADRKSLILIGQDFCNDTSDAGISDDLYMFCATVFFLLTGKDPVSVSDSKSLHSVRNSLLQRGTEWNLIQVLIKGLQKDPKDRPDSMDRIIQSIWYPESPKKLSPHTENSEKKKKYSGKTVFAVAAVLAALAAGGGFVLHSFTKNPDPENGMIISTPETGGILLSEPLLKETEELILYETEPETESESETETETETESETETQTESAVYEALELGREAEEQENYEEALRFYQEVLDASDEITEQSAEAAFHLGFLKEQGLGCRSDLSLAKMLYEEAKEFEPLAYYRLGLMYETGRGAKQSNRQALSCLERASRMGCTEAMYLLALEYETGEGCVPREDPDKAVKIYRKAAESGDSEAANRLGILYSDPTSDLYDPAKAVSYFEKAVELGNEKAAFNLTVLKGEDKE